MHIFANDFFSKFLNICEKLDINRTTEERWIELWTESEKSENTSQQFNFSVVSKVELEKRHNKYIIDCNGLFFSEFKESTYSATLLLLIFPFLYLVILTSPHIPHYPLPFNSTHLQRFASFCHAIQFKWNICWMYCGWAIPVHLLPYYVIIIQSKKCLLYIQAFLRLYVIYITFNTQMMCVKTHSPKICGVLQCFGYLYLPASALAYWFIYATHTQHVQPCEKEKVHIW